MTAEGGVEGTIASTVTGRTAQAVRAVTTGEEASRTPEEKRVTLDIIDNTSRKGPTVAQLIVRNLDADLVKRLKQQAAERGTSAEEEHRQILRKALRPSGFVERLLKIPDIGTDADFDRERSLPREIDL